MRMPLPLFFAAMAVRAGGCRSGRFRGGRACFARNESISVSECFFAVAEVLCEVSETFVLTCFCFIVKFMRFYFEIFGFMCSFATGNCGIPVRGEAGSGFRRRLPPRMAI